jgi:hypothetical protein
MAENKTISIGREKVLAFRLSQNYLDRRLPSGELLQATELCGIRNSPPGSADLSFQARLSEFKVAQLEEALAAKNLLEFWCIRSSPFFFTLHNATVFTQGLLPPDEEALRFYLQTALPVLNQAGVSVTEALSLTSAALIDALDNRQLTKGALSTEVSQRLPEKLLFWCKPCQANHVNESLFRLAVQKAQICFVPRTNGEALFVRSDQWLGIPLPQIEPAQAQLEVLRHYLRGYGPSTPRYFATWAGISPKQASQFWQRLEDELAEVEFQGTKSWLIKEDLAVLESATLPEEVRLLPPYDPYLLLSDRTTLIPDKKLHSEVWRSIGNPGVILAKGEAVGIWRPQKKGKRLLLNLTLFQPVTEKVRAEVESEAEAVATLRGCNTLDLKWDSQD